MPLFIQPESLKTVARLTTQIKEIGRTASKRNYWNRVHRLVGTGNRLRLMTTDQVAFLEWSIAVERGRAEVDFDVLLPAAQFNALALCSAVGGLYEVEPVSAADSLIFRQDQRQLRLTVETHQTYPSWNGPNSETANPDETPYSHRWQTKAKPLAGALEFITPYIDATNPTVAKSVATLSTDGSLTSGSPKRFASIHGLEPPPVPLSFKQTNAKAVTAFLRELTEDVDILVTHHCYVFTCTVSCHKLIVAGECVSYPGDLIQRLNGVEHESYQVDLKTFRNSVNILGAVMPQDSNRLDLRLRGIGGDSSLRLMTSVNEGTSSSDELPVLRSFVGTGGEVETPSLPRETAFALSIDGLSDVLGSLGSQRLLVSYYARKKLVKLDEVPVSEICSIRSVIMTTVQVASQDPGLEVEPSPSDTGPTAANVEPTPDDDAQGPQESEN